MDTCPKVVEQEDDRRCTGIAYACDQNNFNIVKLIF